LQAPWRLNPPGGGPPLTRGRGPVARRAGLSPKILLMLANGYI
jgi:hypothetical protein